MSGRRAAGWLDSAYWLIGPGSAGVAQVDHVLFRCRPGRGHIVAAARLPLVMLMVTLTPSHSLSHYLLTTAVLLLHVKLGLHRRTVGNCWSRRVLKGAEQPGKDLKSVRKGPAKGSIWAKS